MESNKSINIFSKRYLESILKKKKDSGGGSYLGGIIEEYKYYYKFFEKEYRNEYFYKNTLFNKIVLGKHSINTTYALNEVVINKSKADMIIVNRNSPIVYEIKTELDNFDKLEHQIKDYYKISKLVYVVTAENTFYPLYRILKGSNVGIYVLTRRNTLSLKKKAVENTYLEHKALFKLLRKNEYEKIIMGCFGKIPKVRDFEYYTACFELFEQIEINEAYTKVYKELEKRDTVYEKKYLSMIPYELRWLVYTSKFNEASYEELIDIFYNE
ncbi:sce7726 family protein [Lysinibacillus sp. 54212]|uniref:sce7726 family protein n=1 Tax=Lysinibacillus sp. 54212 TaxID=3119829 RepID=UPI002FC890B0